MHTVSPDFLTAFKKSYSASSTPNVTLEWNLNRFGIVDSIKNSGVEIDDDPVFPISSIVAPRRPERSGIVKGFTSVGRSYEAKAYTALGSPFRRRTYTASPDAKYKYWISPGRSSTTPSGGGYPLTQFSPTVVYKNLLPTNKLTVTFENSFANPVNVKIFVTSDGTNWTQAGGSYTPDTNGLITLYLRDDGTWSQARRLGNSVNIKGMRVTIDGMNKPESHCHLIEMAIKREIDVTDRTVDYSISSELSEASAVAPLGTTSSNTGNINLSNHDGYLDNDRAYSYLAGMMSSPAKVTISLDVLAGGKSATEVRQATMFVDSWGEQTEDKRTLTLTDASLFLKQEKPPALLMTNVTATEVIWRILDSIGFSNYQIYEDPSGDATIDYYWTDPEKTVWEHFQDISVAMQVAIYFDEFGDLRVTAREGIFDRSKARVWNFDGQKVTPQIASDEGRPSDTDKLPDIISLAKPGELDANLVNVSYTKTSVSDFNRYQPAMEKVWAPEGDQVLRSATLANDISQTSTTAKFADSNFATWPYEGYLDLEGEIVKWTRKKYRYRTANSSWAEKYIKDNSEKSKLDDLSPTLAHQNHFNGYLYFGSHGRGQMGTVARAHTPSNKFTLNNIQHKGKNSVNKPNAYVKFQQDKSTFRINTTSNFTSDSYVCTTRGAMADSAPLYFGTSLKFDNTSAYKGGAAGIMLVSGPNDSGYYIEINLTSNVGTRTYTNEVSLYLKTSSGTRYRVSKGATVSVVKGKWYDIDVYREYVNGGWRFTVLFNGVRTLQVDATKANILKYLGTTRIAGRYGLFTRSNVHVEFEYIYASNSTEVVPMDNSSRADLINGGLRSNYYNRFLYGNKITERLTQSSTRKLLYNSGFAFDDFGVDAHQLREFNVKFDPSPVIHSRLYMSNQWMADCVEYVSDHDSARFIVAGKGRQNAILNGQDSLLYGPDNEVTQTMLVYGRVVKREEEQSYTVKNENSINRRGPVELDINSPWIQSETAARKIGDWIVNHWPDGSEDLGLSSFGNPFIQIGDTVGVSYRRKGMKSQTHRYYVTGVSHSYSQGLTTDLTLQRISG